MRDLLGFEQLECDEEWKGNTGNSFRCGVAEICAWIAPRFTILHMELTIKVFSAG